MANQNIRFESVNVGDELQAVSVPITVPLIAGGAIATRDYFPGHHDRDAARGHLTPPDVSLRHRMRHLQAARCHGTGSRR